MPAAGAAAADPEAVCLSGLDRAMMYVISAWTVYRKGGDRRGAEMMRKDLAAARKKWIEEAKTPQERAKRERSDSDMDILGRI